MHRLETFFVLFLLFILVRSCAIDLKKCSKDPSCRKKISGESSLVTEIKNLEILQGHLNALKVYCRICP